MMLRARFFGLMGAAAIVLAQGAVGAAAAGPVAVSPGGADGVADTMSVCPTFSWGAVEGAQAYELAVFPVSARNPRGVTRSRVAEGLFAHSAPVIDVTIPAPASSWTPSADRCLTQGRSYVWQVRELDASGSTVGEWSAVRTFRVTGSAGASSGNGGGAAVPQLEGAGNGKGNGTGGIPAVLNQMDQLQEQIDMLQGLVNSRLDAVDARLDGIDHRVEEHDESVQPCTPERWAAGKCAKNNNPMDLKATICFNVELGAQLGLELGVEPGITLALGGSWKDGPDAQAEVNLNLPFFATTPVPIVLPDAKAGVGAAGKGSVQVCLQGVTVKAGDLADPQAAQQFAQKLVDAMQSKAPDIASRIIQVANDRNLTPDRIPDMVDRMEDLHSLRANVSDPLDVLRQGKLRDFVNTLPVDPDVLSFLDDPAQVVPRFDPSQPFAACQDLGNLPIIGQNVSDMCSFVDNDLPDLAEVADDIHNAPQKIVDQLCDSVPGLNCGGSTISCRVQCSNQKSQCLSGCGLFQFSCRRQCDKQARTCASGC